MKKLEVGKITSGSRAPISDRSLAHLQEADRETIRAVLKSLIDDSFLNSTDYIGVLKLHGCAVTDNGDGTFDNESGSVYYQGEIYLVDAGASVAIPNSPAWAIQTTYRTGDPVEFSDGVAKDFHAIEKMILVDSADGSAIENDADTEKFIEVNAQQLESNLFAGVLVEDGLSIGIGKIPSLAKLDINGGINTVGDINISGSSDLRIAGNIVIDSARKGLFTNLDVDNLNFNTNNIASDTGTIDLIDNINITGDATLSGVIDQNGAGTNNFAGDMVMAGVIDQNGAGTNNFSGSVVIADELKVQNFINIRGASNTGVINNTVKNGSLQIAGGDSTADGANIQMGGSLGSNELNIRIGSTNVFNINSSGNVGINTTSPSEKLEVNGNILANGTLLSNDSSDPGVRISTSGVSKGKLIHDTDLEGFVLQSEVSNDYLFFDDAGNIGLNTITPSEKLQVLGTGAFGNTANYISLNASDTTSVLVGRGTSTFNIRSNDASAIMEFQTAGANTRMTIDSSGRVGVGTVTPGELFEVDGNAKADNFIGGYTEATNGDTVDNATFILYTSSGGNINLSSNLHRKGLVVYVYNNGTADMTVDSLYTITPGTTGLLIWNGVANFQRFFN